MDGRLNRAGNGAGGTRPQFRQKFAQPRLVAACLRPKYPAIARRLAFAPFARIFVPATDSFPKRADPIQRATRTISLSSPLKSSRYRRRNPRSVRWPGRFLVPDTQNTPFPFGFPAIPRDGNAPSHTRTAELRPSSGVHAVHCADRRPHTARGTPSGPIRPPSRSRGAPSAPIGTTRAFRAPAEAAGPAPECRRHRILSFGSCHAIYAYHFFAARLLRGGGGPSWTEWVRTACSPSTAISVHQPGDLPLPAERDRRAVPGSSGQRGFATFIGPFSGV